MEFHYLKKISLNEAERKYVVEHHAEETILQMARALNISPYKLTENLKLMELEPKESPKGHKLKEVGKLIDESKYSTSKGCFDIDKYFQATYL